MPATTSKGYPYPLGTDRVMDGDDAIKNLAQFADTNVGIHASGIATLPAPSALNTPVSLAVTLPAGRFPQAPHIQLTLNQTTSPQTVSPLSSSSQTTTGFTIWHTRLTGGLVTQLVHWHAMYTP